MSKISPYKPVQVYSNVKDILKSVKSELGLKNESETIAYMYEIYKTVEPSITMDQHKATIKKTQMIASSNKLDVS